MKDYHHEQVQICKAKDKIENMTSNVWLEIFLTFLLNESSQGKWEYPANIWCCKFKKLPDWQDFYLTLSSDWHKVAHCRSHYLPDSMV